jgi:hypothetical protein
MSQATNEKRKSISNSRNDILDARIIANYSDPGLYEDYAFDILSRYLIVHIESSYRVPTADAWNKNIAIVARPKNLWIDAEEGLASSPSAQKRNDQTGNISVGIANAFTTNGIAPIDKPYQIGELIKIKKLANSLKFWDADPIFESVFSLDSDSSYVYNSWHNEGSTFPYFVGQDLRQQYLRAKTLFRPDGVNYSFWYGMTLYKYQYEAFMLTLAQNNSELTTYLENMFGNVLSNTESIYLANGGYVFKEQQFINMFSVDYEDVNVINRSRPAISDCVPLIVTAPTTWPVPKIRNTSLLSYNPSYSTIIKSS